MCFFFISPSTFIVHCPFIIIILIQHFEGRTHYGGKKVIAQLIFFTITFVITAFKLSIGLIVFCVHLRMCKCVQMHDNVYEFLSLLVLVFYDVFVRLSVRLTILIIIYLSS